MSLMSPSWHSGLLAGMLTKGRMALLWVGIESQHLTCDFVLHFSYKQFRVIPGEACKHFTLHVPWAWAYVR